jgi:hypothetical protein
MQWTIRFDGAPMAAAWYAECPGCRADLAAVNPPARRSFLLRVFHAELVPMGRAMKCGHCGRVFPCIEAPQECGQDRRIGR